MYFNSILNCNSKLNSYEVILVVLFNVEYKLNINYFLYINGREK